MFQWLVVQARKISDEIGADNVATSFFPHQQRHTMNSLDSFGYDEAAKYVYGSTYSEWKKLHQKEASDEQMQRYNGSMHIHAKHDKELLALRSKGVPSLAQNAPPVHSPKTQVCIDNNNNTMQQQKNSLLSDVCCQDVETDVPPTSGTSHSMTYTIDKMPRPPKGIFNLNVGMVTVSDRAAANAYEKGDLSGPAIESTLASLVAQMNASYDYQKIIIAHIEKKIVADEIPDIKEILLQWSGKKTDAGISPHKPYDLIFTTGGTGFGRRDVTPEATLSILDRECQGLMSWASMKLTIQQPLATLSRAAAGTCGNTVIINLPGNPAGAAQVVETLFPLLLHAIKDLR